jgi:predicted DNA-binding protein
MAETFTLHLSDAIAQRIKHYAEKTQRPVETVISEWLEHYITEMPVALLSDEELLVLSDLQLPEDQQAELSELLQQQQNATLSGNATQRLNRLMHVYNQALVRKAEAFRELAKRNTDIAHDSPAE